MTGDQPIFTGVALKVFLSFDKCMSDWRNSKDKMDNDIDKLGITFYGKAQAAASGTVGAPYVNTLDLMNFYC